MPITMELPASSTTQENPPTTPLIPYPVAIKSFTAQIASVPTTATSHSFSTHIMLTLTQSGRLAQWIHVPLSPSNPEFSSQYLNSNEDSLLPMSHLTPKTLLGGADAERETMGQLIATQIASMILTKRLEERRMLVLGLGLEVGKMGTADGDWGREGFFDLVQLATKVI